ncbi:hypothetical protein [Desulfoferrobacter suflitae]|uniref:hypothetical protein n=1 Tax=Desulfoferrobacter suflitae TaxID=2865782 RepID=UPI00216443CA|nr:hypothetical protein [Desulfoferrobacter suflitae]MCK8602872.1 hypothetical protein [Desulfoferrobacter suflitae]
MDQKQMFKQMIDFNKTAFDNAFNSMAMLQEQAERMTGMVLEQATWLPKEGKKVIDEWVKAYKKGRENFKSSMEDSFKKVEEFFAETTKTK